MIKKTTVAVFNNGAYKGEYDWQGGIPLSVGESISVSLKGTIITYKLVGKTTSLEVGDQDQVVTTSYQFDITN